MLNVQEKFHHFLKIQYAYKRKHLKDFALHVAPIVALKTCRFNMKFLQVFQWRLFCIQVKLVSVLKTKSN